MLDPNTRNLYTSLLTPPPGFVLDQALATTYSLDIQTMLTIPVHLSLLGAERHEDGIAVYEAVRRTMDRVTVYLQRGQIHAPQQGNSLYGLLEPCMVEVEPPGAGVFHPKLWLLRFQPGEGIDEEPRLRLAVLSRNVTDDRCWDLALQLEGRIGSVRCEVNKPLAQLIRALPRLACVDVEAAREAQAPELAQNVMYCDFELPDGAETIEFAVPGLQRGRWGPEPSDRLAVISPFCSTEALTELAASSTKPVALISRPEALEEIGSEARDVFAGQYVLHEAAESEDNEGETRRDTHGLHAKAWIAEQGPRTAITLGSANTTNAALVAQHNLELLVTLEGPRRKLGGIGDLLGDEGLGAVLQPWAAGEQGIVENETAVAAQRRLQQSRVVIARSGLQVACEPGETEGRWCLMLHGGVDLLASVRVRVWPVSRPPSDAVGFDPGAGVTELARVGPAHLTGVVAFELTDPDAEEALRFALNLPVDGLPADEREAAILRAVIGNREGFLRYLMLLLAGDDVGASGFMRTAGAGSGRWRTGSMDDLPLLEELTRCYSREPERLRDVAGIIERLRERTGTADVIPAEFDALWKVYQQALESRDA